MILAWFLALVFTCVAFRVILANVRFPKRKPMFLRSSDVKDNIKTVIFHTLFIYFLKTVFSMDFKLILGRFSGQIWKDFLEMLDFQGCQFFIKICIDFGVALGANLASSWEVLGRPGRLLNFSYEEKILFSEIWWLYKSRRDFATVLGPFWDHFGTRFGTVFTSCWNQFGTIFGSLLGPFGDGCHIKYHINYHNIYNNNNHCINYYSNYLNDFCSNSYSTYYGNYMNYYIKYHSNY